jgi:hypothetical protein
MHLMWLSSKTGDVRKISITWKKILMVFIATSSSILVVGIFLFLIGFRFSFEWRPYFFGHTEENYQNQEEIKTLLRDENLGVQIRYVEKQYGLTAYIRGENFSAYKIGDCLISFDGDKYSNIEKIGISSFFGLEDRVDNHKCPIARFLEKEYFEKSSFINLEQFLDDFPFENGEFRIFCFDCGNAASPRLEVFIQAGHSGAYRAWIVELDDASWWGEIREATEKMKFPEAPANLTISFGSDLGKVLLESFKTIKVVSYKKVIGDLAIRGALTDCRIDDVGITCKKQKAF